MLGKLMKHDMKALSRYLLLFHGFGLVLAIVGRLFLGSQFNNTEPSIAFVLYMMLFIISIMVIAVGTYIIIAINFYKNLFSHEGYLSFTLPVTSGQHLLSKTLTASLWATLDGIMIVLYLVIFLSFPDIWAEVPRLFQVYKEATGQSIIPIFIYTGIMFLISCWSGVMLLYLSIAIGQLFSSHRVIASIVAYFAISTVTQIIVSIGMLLGGWFYSDRFIEAAESASYTFGHIYGQTLLYSGLFCVIEGIVAYLVTYFIMKKRVNLV